MRPLWSVFFSLNDLFSSLSLFWTKEMLTPSNLVGPSLAYTHRDFPPAQQRHRWCRSVLSSVVRVWCVSETSGPIPSRREPYVFGDRSLT